MSIKVYQAGGWLASGTSFSFQRQDQGQDLVIPWQGIIQAPGAGVVTRVGSDRAFPNGFGPSYPYVQITTGRWSNHEWYIGHCTSLVRPGQKFTFGTPLARADQGHNFEGTNGGWVELGQAFNGIPDHFSANHWYRNLFSPLTVVTPDTIYKQGSLGWNVLKFTGWLRTLTYLSRGWFHFNRTVYSAVIKFQKDHHLAVDGVVGPITWNAINHSVQDWKKK